MHSRALKQKFSLRSRRTSITGGGRVYFCLRTGKCLHVQFSEIVVEFKPVPHSIYPRQRVMDAPNRLIIRPQPEENEPDATLDAYQRLLLDVIRENPTLFVCADEVEDAWIWVDKIKALSEGSGKPRRKTPPVVGVPPAPSR